MILNMEEIINTLKEKVSKGFELEQAIVELHEKGLTIIQSMQVIVKVFGLSLSEAKLKVSSHPIWSDIVESSEPLHEELSKKA